MEESMGTNTGGMPQEQRELFERVWSRVMDGSDQASCPIAWEDSTAAQESETGESAFPMEPLPQENSGGQALMPVRPVPSGSGDRPQNDFPRGESMGFLGSDCLDSGPLLQDLIRRELADWREYQLLARRTGGAPARVFASLAGEKKRHAKRLSAAYFLIAGIRYWPEGEGCTPPASYLGALRRRFIQEQEAMAAYLTGAEGTADPCLQQMFVEHARDAWDHACKIRQLVEQA